MKELENSLKDLKVEKYLKVRTLPQNFILKQTSVERPTEENIMVKEPHEQVDLTTIEPSAEVLANMEKPGAEVIVTKPPEKEKELSEEEKAAEAKKLEDDKTKKDAKKLEKSTVTDEPEKSEEELKAEKAKAELDSKKTKQPGKEEIVFAYEGSDGKKREFTLDQLKELGNDMVAFRKTNTEKAQTLSADREAFKLVQDALNGQIIGLKELLENEEVMEALDDHYDGKENNLLRKFDLQQLSKSEEDSDALKRVKALEKKETDKAQVEADKKAAVKAYDAQVKALVTMDPTLANKEGEVDDERLEKITKFAVDYNNANPDGPYMTLKEAWIEVEGKNRMKLAENEKSTKDAKKTVKGPGAKKETKKLPKSLDDVAEMALKDYEEKA